jgi:hypothetical protein
MPVRSSIRERCGLTVPSLVDPLLAAGLRERDA